MTKKIVVDFKNILSELENKKIRLCFVKSKWLFIEDEQGNMYQMETCYYGSYLDKLIKNGSVVDFNYIDISLAQNIGDREKESWDVSEVKSFIRRQKL